MSIFRAYDVRGIYGADLTEDIAQQIGAAFGTLLGGSGKVVLGRDGRVSSPALAKAVATGLTEAGCDVLDMGLIPTPALYFGIKASKAKGGIMVTASHNPPEWNGLKICDSKAGLMGMGLGLEKIKEIVEQGKFKLVGNGKVIDSKHLLEEYADFLLSKVDISKGTRVVLDPGGGSSAVLARKLFERAGCEVYVINEEIDPYFRARSPDPDPDNLEELKEEVLKREAVLGIAFDGDGDRSVFVDDRGRGIQGDLALAVYVRHYLKGKEGAKVVYEVSCTKAIEDITREMGGKLVMCRVGHAFLMDLMLKEKALLGGEISSHFYFGDAGIYSDGLFAGLRMLEVISKEGRLSSLVDGLPKYFSTPIITVFVPDEVKFKLVKEAGLVVKEKGLKTLEIDGVRAYTKEGWFLIRASNTKPEIKIRAESTSEEGLKNLFGEVTKVIKEAASRLGVKVEAPKWRYKKT
ncbi:MAG: phosphomannomutase [Thermoproteota archaeon]|nr:MAG: phosphomannomutase [Candidatus Korarchaeota archaeon]